MGCPSPSSRGFKSITHESLCTKSMWNASKKSSQNPFFASLASGSEIRIVSENVDDPYFLGCNLSVLVYVDDPHSRTSVPTEDMPDVNYWKTMIILCPKIWHTKYHITQIHDHQFLFTWVKTNWMSLGEMGNQMFNHVVNQLITCCLQLNCLFLSWYGTKSLESGWKM